MKQNEFATSGFVLRGREFVHVLTRIGDQPYGLTDELHMPDGLQIASLLTDFAYQWNKGIIEKIGTFFHPETIKCGQENIQRTIETMRNTGIILEGMGMPMKAINKNSWQVELESSGGGMHLLLEKYEGQFKVTSLTMQESLLKTYFVEGAQCGAKDTSNPALNLPHTYSPESCPPGKSCYPITMKKGKIISVDWSKQTTNLKDRTHQIKYHLGHNGGLATFKLQLPDQVIIEVQANEEGDLIIEGVPKGDVKTLSVQLPMA